MTPPEAEPGSSRQPQDWFPTTHWSVVLAAGEESSQQANLALESLCRSYWQPLYSFIRRSGHSTHDAEDLTQAYLVHLLERKALQRVSAQKGRFRSFLIAALRYFLANELQKYRAQKRGGGVPVLSLDVERAERHYQLEPADTSSPDEVFERSWAMTVIDEVLDKMESELIRGGEGERWKLLKQCLMGDADALPYGEIATKLGLSQSAVKMSVRRLRLRFRELLRFEIARTVGSPDEVEPELRHLLSVMT